MNIINAINQEITDVCPYEIHLSKEYSEPKYTLSLNGVGTIPRGDIQAIKAKSKNGKTFLSSIFMASVFGCKDFGFDAAETSPTVLYFDTEQNERNTAMFVRRVHTLLNWDIHNDHEGLHAYTLRTMDMLQRFPFIQKTVNEKKPTMVIIDGIADLIANFNDEELSYAFLGELAKLSTDNDCAIVCVLHTNKSKDDNNMKGHLGSALTQKSSDVFEVRKVGDIFSVTETENRNQNIDDFSFVIDSNGIPHTTATIRESQERVKEDDFRAHLKEAFGDKPEMSYTELVQAYQLNMAVGERTAKRAVATAKSNKYIKVTNNGKYSLVTR
jgi:RecA-family ATPase